MTEKVSTAAPQGTHTPGKGRKIYAVELHLWAIDVEPNGPSEGERIVKKQAVFAHYDGSRTEAEAHILYERCDAILNGGKTKAAVNRYAELLTALKRLRAASSAMAMAIVFGLPKEQYEPDFNAAHDAATAAIKLAEGGRS